MLVEFLRTIISVAASSKNKTSFFLWHKTTHKTSIAVILQSNKKYSTGTGIRYEIQDIYKIRYSTIGYGTVQDIIK